MIRGIMDTGKRRRRDAIVARHFAGEITREDYAQLAQDGYTDLALELAAVERDNQAVPPDMQEILRLIGVFEREAAHLDDDDVTLLRALRAARVKGVLRLPAVDFRRRAGGFFNIALFL